MSSLLERRRARLNYKKVASKEKPGQGGRFEAVMKSAKLGGAKNPRAVAGAIMWRKYGKKGGARLIAMGRARRRRHASA